MLVTPCISDTVRPRVVKFCVRILHSLRMISMEKKFGKVEKKFRDFLLGFFSELKGDRREPIGEFALNSVRNFRIGTL